MRVLGIITLGIFLASWYSWTLMTRQKMFFFHAFAKSREWLWLNGLFSPLKHNQWNKAKFGMTTKWGFQEARTRKDLKITLLVVEVADLMQNSWDSQPPLCFCHPDVRGLWALLLEEAAGEVCGLYLSKSAGQCLPSCQTNLKAMAIEKGL